ncbi:MAG: photosystem P840 reaction-center cytochrome c-551 [Nitrospirae bacterium]|nr:photosystem P840 reaction-center cytochrome c-551 [Nitrospirota bacterium]
MKQIVIVSLALIFCLTGVTAYGAGEVKVDAKALFEQKCSQCHDIERPKSKKKTGKEWESIVMRMKNTNGCKITDEEAKIIIGYLTATYGN